MGELTRLLNAAMHGDAAAQGEVYRQVEPELRKLARNWIQRYHDHGKVRTTLVVDLTFQRLINAPHLRWEDRKMFYCFAAKNMLQILIDMSRDRHRRAQHEVSVEQQQLDQLAISSDFSYATLVSLRDALEKLEPDMRTIIELRFLLEHTLDEISEIISLPRSTVHRKCRLALAFLRRELSEGDGHDAGDLAAG